MYTIPAEKRCSKCGIVKVRAEFYTLSSTRSGFRSRCIDCSRKDEGHIGPRIPRGKPLEDRFWAFVLIGDGCWEWTGSIGTGGYGHFGDGAGGKVAAHRFSWSLWNGKIPEGMFVCHHCDNRKCTRPSHLFVGTNEDNVNDMVSKNRHTPGSRNAGAKLTEADVAIIRSMPVYHGSRTAIARMFGVSQSIISDIVSGKRWKHVQLPAPPPVVPSPDDDPFL
jgi:hypothetical protein